MSSEADHRLASLTNPLTSNSDSGSLIDIIDSGVEHSDAGLRDGDFKKVIRILSKSLTDIERDIVFWKHGISDNGNVMEEGFPEIAKRLERTPESIRQKYKKALKKMQAYGRRISLRDYDVI
jgi:DNA-directed RNA polymerase sigma subunit (sigma70/sigma32)